ncbi:MAG TPA: tetratricopeptide repeat protein [Anaerolineales bacterium]|jgi:class 3 adenylate cyclase/tetratricopeptide (TPR) repeat protein
MTLQTYLPQDRLRALARNETLPDRTSGSALIADISGFTGLTEALRQALGTRHGAEELTKHLDAVYSVLIDEVERYGGSVIGFAGDAITCWFDQSQGEPAALATSCAFALQEVMRSFSTIQLPNQKPAGLSVKVAIATGLVRRFSVGDPDIQRLDALVGATVARTSTAEHLAKKGSILLDETTVNLLGSSLVVTEWCEDPETHEHFAVGGKFNHAVQPIIQSPLPTLSNEQLRSWIHPQVFDREIHNQGAFLTEFRPCLALFVRFQGIDYDSDAAEEELDAFIKKAQKTAVRHGGTLMDITIGDKGSYLYINLGALSAHEDDARRAIKIARELRDGSNLQTQIGITQGMMRVGAIGGEKRRAYGALGDDVNLAARLMQTAAPGEILVSGHVHNITANDFTFDPHPPLPMKGKTEPLPVFAVMGERQQRAIRLQEPAYALPMVGRRAEVKIIAEKLDLTLKGQSQIIGIVADAGMGKSRLVAEVIRLAHKQGFAGYGGVCQSDAINTPYLAWKAILAAFFDVDPSAPYRKQIRSLEGEIEDRAPERVQAMPLLGSLLDLEIPDNDFTRTLEPEFRQSTLRALLEDCLRATAQDEPLLIVIEDLHWIDPLSHDLLEELARALTDKPVCFVLAYRPPELARLEKPRLEAMPNFTKIELKELTVEEAEQAIRAKLVHLYPAGGGSLPTVLVEKLMSRAQGNPFYLEELLNYLHDRGLNPRDPNTLEKIELPDSLHTLILSRIDQLSEHEKMTLRVASIIGRSFRAAWLTGYYPELGSMPQVVVDLNELSTLDITPLDSTETELIYLFKHIVTHEVTYESLPFTMRAQLHEHLAQFLESTYPENPPLDALAFHYGLTNNLSKKREYIMKAAEAAFSVFSNESALEYYNQAMGLTTEPASVVDIHLKSGEIKELIGTREDAAPHYKAALQIAESNNLTQLTIKCLIKVGFTIGDYQQSLVWVKKAYEIACQINEPGSICDALIELSDVYWRMGNLNLGLQHAQKAISLARQENDRAREALACFFAATICGAMGDYVESHKNFETTLAIAREMNDMRRIGSTLLNCALTYYYEGDYQTARKYTEESLNFSRKIGDKRHTTIALNNLGNIFFIKGDFQSAQGYYLESLSLARELADRYSTSIAVSSLGILAFQEGRLEEAEGYYQEGMAISQALGHKDSIALIHCYQGLLALARHDELKARRSFQEGLKIAFESNLKAYVIYNLIGFACVYQAENNPRRAAQLLGAVNAIGTAAGFKIELELEQPYETTLLAAKGGLGQEAFDEAWRTGQQMTMDEAVKSALTEES